MSYDAYLRYRLDIQITETIVQYAVFIAFLEFGKKKDQLDIFPDILHETCLNRPKINSRADAFLFSLRECRERWNVLRNTMKSSKGKSYASLSLKKRKKITGKSFQIFYRYKKLR